MLTFPLQQARRVLCLGAHPDDIEIGCGGGLLTLLEEPERVDVCWVVFSGSEARAEEARRSADRFLTNAKHRLVEICDFPDRWFPYSGEALKNRVHEIAGEFSPDLIFSHRRKDQHQDHRLLAELTWHAFRDHLILEYEIPKYEGDLGQPNLFVPLSEEAATRKVETITEVFRSQHDKYWFDPQTLWSLLRLRGLECRSSSGFAEGFHCRKLVLSGASQG